MLTDATSETHEVDVENYEGHQALLPKQPHGPPHSGHRHGPRQGPKGPLDHALSQITLLLDHLFLHQSFRSLSSQ